MSTTKLKRWYCRTGIFKKGEAFELAIPSAKPALCQLQFANDIYVCTATSSFNAHVKLYFSPLCLNDLIIQTNIERFAQHATEKLKIFSLGLCHESTPTLQNTSF